MPEIQIVTQKPLSVIITLPSGCSAGRWEAAEAFAESFKQLGEQFPGKQFQLLPFSYQGGGGGNQFLEYILAVAL